MLDKLHVAGRPIRARILILLLSLVLLGALLCSHQAFRTASRDRHPLPNIPIVVHHKDHIWIVDGDADIVTHGPYCLSGFWTQVGIGDVEVAPNGHLYASFPMESYFDRLWGKTVVELDPATSKEIDRIEVLINPNHMVRIGGNLLYVSTGMVSTGVARVVVIDMETNTIANEIILDLPCEPNTMVLGSDGKLYVSACWSLAEIDTATNSVSYSPTEFKPNISDMALGSDGYLYLLLFNEIHIVDPDNWTTIASIDQDSDLVACSGLYIATAEGRAFVTCHDTQAIVVYDVASNAITSTSLPDWYFEIAAVSKGKLYLVQKDAEKVLVLDVRSDKMLTEIPLCKDGK